MINQLKFLIRITEGTTVIRGEEYLNIDDFPLNSFIIDTDEVDIYSRYHQFIEEYYPNCEIISQTFLVYPLINDEELGIELSEDIDPNEVHLEDIESWIKSEKPKQWFRNYQLENNLGIKDFNLEDVSTFSEEQLKTLMSEIEKNPLIIVPDYLLKSQIMEYLPVEYKRQNTLNSVLDEIDEEYFLKIKNIITNNLSNRIRDDIFHNLEDWLDLDEED